jgi:L-rhamnonate dehydratase
MEIAEVVTWTAPFSSGTWLDESRISTPLNPYPAFRDRRSSWRGQGSALTWVILRSDDPAVFGVGQTRGGSVTEALIRDHYAPLLRGAVAAPRPLAELLRRASGPYADGGIQAMAVSAVELALWDLVARAAGVPLVELLGGAPGTLPYYLTAPDPELLLSVSAEILEHAHTVKVPMPDGPEDGMLGMRRNLERVERVRELIPGHVGVSVDCFMSWDRAYAQRFANAARDLGLDWIEEPLRPGDAAGYRALRDSLGGIRIAGGEHSFGLEQGLRFLEDAAVDVFQADVTWCGGIATAQTLADVAHESGTVFAPHAAGLQPWSLHLLGAMGPQVLTEVLLGLNGDVTLPAIGDGPGVGLDPETLGAP